MDTQPFFICRCGKTLNIVTTGHVTGSYFGQSDTADYMWYEVEPCLCQLPRWIRVEERLPDLNEVVLTIYQTREGFGAITLRSRFDDDYWYCGEVGGLVPNRNITHWMPLPPPPEDE